MKRNIDKALKLTEEKGLAGLFYQCDIEAIKARNNFLLSDSILEALRVGAAIGYQAAVKDMKAKE